MTSITDDKALRARAAFLNWLRPDENVLHVVVDGRIVIDRLGTSKVASQGALNTLGAYNLLVGAQVDGDGPKDMDIVIGRKGCHRRCIVGRETDSDLRGHGYAVMFIPLPATIKIIRRSIRAAIRDAWGIRHRRLVIPRPRRKTSPPPISIGL